MNDPHSFYIPVMGTGFTIDTPVKVAKYGISSVISLVDDALIEEMRQYHCRRLGWSYQPITRQDKDFRAQRITEYLNLLDRIVKHEFEKLRTGSFDEGTELFTYFSLLPDHAPLKKKYQTMRTETNSKTKKDLQDQLRAEIKPGHIDVNIMTKLNRPHYDRQNNLLPEEFCEALSALRGYAQSTLSSAIVFSAGFNRHLYSYTEKFKDFYADASGFIKKKIILKVTDYRSSVIQGKFFAKKGLWVSEYRVESGLNCGGHTFAANGQLMGPILDEFKKKKETLVKTLHKIYNEALKIKMKTTYDTPHAIQLTAQGGIGTTETDKFLMRHYGLDQTGWGTPFLLTPDATNVDKDSLEKLLQAGEEDVGITNVSPLGVPFQNLKNSASELEKNRRAEAGSPGSPCPKGRLKNNTEFTENPLCTASRAYQKLKIEETRKLNLTADKLKAKLRQIMEKSCICHDLGESARLKNEIAPQETKKFPAVCPGPNIAYFDKITSLEEMVAHIYGKINILKNKHLPNIFIKELSLYIKHFFEQVPETKDDLTTQQISHLNEFLQNLLEGIRYYKGLFPKMVEETQEYKERVLSELDELYRKIKLFVDDHLDLFPALAPDLLPTV